MARHGTPEQYRRWKRAYYARHRARLQAEARARYRPHPRPVRPDAERFCAGCGVDMAWLTWLLDCPVSAGHLCHLCIEELGGFRPAQLRKEAV